MTAPRLQQEPSLKALGRTGTRISEVGLGTWQYHAGPDPLRRGLEAGARFIDTAELYLTEEAVGQAIRGMRERVFLATKVSPWNLRPDNFKKSLDASLSRLGTDTIDLYQIHEPNPDIPIEETMGAMADAIAAGKVRYAGVSNFSVAQMKAAQRALGNIPIVSNQVRYSIIDRTIERAVLPYCRSNGITVIAYCPLGRDFQRLLDCDPTNVLEEVGRAIGKSRAQVAINWCLCQEGVVAIPKGNSVEHILDNCGAAGWRLADEHLALLDSRIRHRSRSGLDVFVRKHLPGPLLRIGTQAIRHLPAGLRRRVN